ncbi:MAG: flagellar protein FlbD [Erysipelotrichia bacterium]|nr:flagellar protein FlbD [Erysipelotrichia bacterium]
MIKLSRMNGDQFYLNAELIEQVESTPDTIITLISGKTVMVANSLKNVLTRILRYKQRVHGRYLKKRKP